MGGGNGQKSAAARLRNMKDKKMTDEERKAASAKAKADSMAHVCKVCRATFMVNVKPSGLYLHVNSKHPKISPIDCFDQLVDYDPNDPDGLKKVACTVAKGPIKPKKKKKEEGLEDLLSAGLNIGKKKKGKK